MTRALPIKICPVGEGRVSKSGLAGGMSARLASAAGTSRMGSSVLPLCRRHHGCANQLIGNEESPDLAVFLQPHTWQSMQAVIQAKLPDVVPAAAVAVFVDDVPDVPDVGGRFSLVVECIQVRQELSCNALASQHGTNKALCDGTGMQLA